MSWWTDFMNREDYGIPVFDHDEEGRVVLLTRWPRYMLIATDLLRLGKKSLIRRQDQEIEMSVLGQDARYRVVQEDEVYIGVELVEIIHKV